MRISKDSLMLHRVHILVCVRAWRYASVVAAAYAAYLLLSAVPAASRTATLLYLASVAVHFGAQIWMTFISGIVLFFKLPRKLFGMVQRHLFPKYFLLNSTTAFITLWVFMLQNPLATHSQSWILASSLLCELLGAAYIVPCMVSTMEERSRTEEAGKSEDHARLHAKFRKLHGLCAGVNFLSMACTTLHLYHLACRLADQL